MDEKKRVEKLRELILDEIKAGTDSNIGVICWDKGCKLAMETTVPPAENDLETLVKQ